MAENLFSLTLSLTRIDSRTGGPQQETEVMKYALDALEETSVRTGPEMFFGVSEMAFYQPGLDTPAIILGPGPFDQAHNPNEYVTERSLETVETAYGAVVDATIGSSRGGDPI